MALYRANMEGVEVPWRPALQACLVPLESDAGVYYPNEGKYTLFPCPDEGTKDASGVCRSNYTRIDCYL